MGVGGGGRRRGGIGGAGELGGPDTGKLELRGRRVL